jgi:glutaredoxin
MKASLRILAFLGCMMVIFQPTAQAGQGLEEQALRAAVAKRVNLILIERGQEAVIPVEAISIEKVQPVQVRDITLYAVKLSLRAGGNLNGIFSEPEEMIILTDESGTLQFGMVTDIATGYEAAMFQAADLTRMAFPDHLAKPYLTGQGNHEVTIVSDPFCPYCRQALEYLTSQLSRIANLKLVHLPLAMHPGAEAAVWIMEFAREEAADLYKLIVNFAYTDLQVPAGDNGQALHGDEAQKNVIKQFLGKFPQLAKQPLDAFLYYLKGKYEPQDLAARKILQKLQISGTPVVIIDGQPVHGFDQKEIGNRLNK